MEFDFQRVLMYGIILGVLAYLLYARYVKNKKPADEKKIESAPACPVVADKDETSKEE